MRKVLFLVLSLVFYQMSWGDAGRDSSHVKGVPDLTAVQVLLGDDLSPNAPQEVTNIVERDDYWLWLIWDVDTSTDVRYQVKGLIRDLDTGSTLEGCTDVITTGDGDFELRCPLWRAQEGNFRLIGEVDSRGDIDEADETNNLVEVDFQVGPRGGGPQCLSGNNKGQAGNPDEFEPDDLFEQARAIRVGELENEDFRYPQRHNFHMPGDYDWVKFHTEFDPRRDDFLIYAIQILQPGFAADLALELYDAAGRLREDFGDGGVWDFNGAGEEESRLWKPDTEGVFYLCARQSDGSVFGTGTNYDLDVSITEPDGGRITGAVKDGQSGTGIELALLQTDPSTSFRWSTLNGEYAMVNLGPGFYDLQVDALGYKSRVINDIEVNLGEETRVDVSLARLAVSPYQVSAAQSGSYFDPSHDGEGWLLEILSLPTTKADGRKAPGVALAYWFTFPGSGPDKGAAAEQAWLVGVGEIENDVITFRNALQPGGGMFGPEFVPTDVARAVWGDFEFRFSDCDNGTMNYIGPPGWEAGSLELKRITALAGLDCADGEKRSGKADSIGPAISGSWFDPTHDGEGWLVEVLDEKTALVYWFSYDEDGDQAWWVGVGTIDGKTITVEDALLPSGTVFGAAFDSADIVLNAWGRMIFSFDSCESGNMTYESDIEAFGSGALVLERITSIPGLSCQ